jgi:hypothetical protein
LESVIMRLRRFIAACWIAVSAGVLSAQPVLTSDSSLYTIGPAAEGAGLTLTRRIGDVRETVLVPSTDDAVSESDARLLYDTCANVLFVIWNRAAEGANEIRIASRDGAGAWSEPVVVATSEGSAHAGLTVALTHPAEEPDAPHITLVHAAWWDLAEQPVARYGLVAFEAAANVSTDVVRLVDLFEARAESIDVEDTGAAIHPPLTLAPAGEELDVVFGAPDTTAVTRVRISPSHPVGNARIWRPIGRSADATGPARFVSANSTAVQAFISNDRVVLYTPDSTFRFIVFDNGVWSPERSIQLNDFTTDDILRALRDTVAQQDSSEPPPVINN